MAKPKPRINSDIEKMFASVKLPGVDFDAVIASQRSLLHKANDANALACEALGSVASQPFILAQQSLLIDGLESIASLLRESFGNSSPEDKVVLTEQFIRGAVERFIGYLKEAAELVVRAGAENVEQVIAVMNKKFAEGMKEMQAMLEKAQRRA